MDQRITSYLQKNRSWAAGSNYYTPIPFKDMQRKGREREDGTVIVVACTDPRVTPEEFLGMDASTKATVVRTAGGRVQAAMSTLLVLSAVGNNGKKGVIMVVHHTDCGLAHATDQDIAAILSTNVETEEEIAVLNGMEFGSFVDPEVSVREDVDALKKAPFFRGIQVLGFVQDTETGVLREVVGV